MRSGATLAVAVLLATTALPACASGLDNKSPDMESQAQPREQCFLYAELVHQMTELSLKQYSAGDVSKATDLLKRVQQFAQKIHLSMAQNDKRIKNAEILLSHTVFRLTEMLHSTSYEDRPLVQETLADVTQAQKETMFQVFKK